MAKQSPWEGGHAASQTVRSEEDQISRDIYNDCVDAFSAHAGHLDREEAFGIIMSSLDAIAALLVRSFTIDRKNEEQAVELVAMQHARNIVKIIRNARERDHEETRN